MHQRTLRVRLWKGRGASRAAFPRGAWERSSAAYIIPCGSEPAREGVSHLKHKPPVKHRLVIQRQHPARKNQVQVMTALGATA
ncbi:hypothetical protein DMX04_16210 [Pseudomonas koreensis]|nr:hypothetical protein DMX04_16210 [Pseudomonas koreensis]